MGILLGVVLGIAVGVYFADKIREIVARVLGRM